MKAIYKYITCAICFITLAIVCCFSISYNVAFAWTTDDWRPSVEINKDIANTTNQINLDNETLDNSQNFVAEYEQNSDKYDIEVSEMQERYDNIKQNLEENSQDIEEISKNSYAAYFAKKLLDDIVGDAASDWLFHWGFVTFIVYGQDNEISSLINDFVNAKIELDFAIENKNTAAQTYEQSKVNIQNCTAELPVLQNHLAYLQEQLPQILEIEQIYGAAGESRIVGNGLFCHPCPDGVITANFGDEREGYVHAGTDFGADQDTPIYVACDGVVIDVGEDEKAGKYIKVDHQNGFVTIYMHCNHIFVPNGMRVHKGDNIALVGNTGESTGPHLHFQLMRNGTAVNCLDYIN